jgi:hypothetical protein
VSKVVVLEPDLLFSSKIESAGRKSGLDVKVVVTFEELQRMITTSIPKILLVNLDVLLPEAIPFLSSAKGSCRLIGYYSHVNSKLATAALANGFEVAIPRRTFTERLVDIFADIGSS